MNKKVIFGTLALMLGGMAGAQTGCVQPVIPELARFTNGDTVGQNISPWTLAGDQTGNSWKPATLGGTGGGLATESGIQTLLITGDTTGPGERQIIGVPLGTSFDAVRFLKAGAYFSNNGTSVGGRRRIIDFSYGGQVYARLVTAGIGASQPQQGFLYGVNGGSVYDAQGNVATATDPNGYAPAGTTGLIIRSNGGAGIDPATAGNGNTIPNYTQFYIRLPDSAISADAAYEIVASTDEVSRIGALLIDDVQIFKPETVATTVCLQKVVTQPNPTLTFPTDWRFRLNNVEGSGIAGVNEIDPATNTAEIGVNVASPDTVYTQTPIALRVLNKTVNVAELTAGDYAISSIDCSSPAFREKTNFLTQPAGNLVIGPSGNSFNIDVPDSSKTTCTVTNTGRSLPKLTTNKLFPKGRAQAGDQATISQTAGTAPNVSNNSYQTSGAGTTVGYTSATRTIQPPATFGAPVVTTVNGAPNVRVDLNGSYALSTSETMANAANYTNAYECVNTQRPADAATNPKATGTSVTITASLGDNITCTFTNTSTVVAPETTVNVSKTGPAVIAVGAPTGAVTYTITVNLPGGLSPRPYIVLKDKITLSDGTLLPASAVTLPDGGTFDEATQTVTWAGISNGSPSTNPYQVTVQLPNKTVDVNNGDTYTGPNLITDTATVETYTNSTKTVPLTNNGTATGTVRTNLLFVQVRKTVQNVTKAGRVGTSAQAEPGDVLQYCLNYTNQSAVPMTLTLRDTIVDTQTLVANSFTGGTNTGTGNQVNVAVPGVAAGASGSVCFQAKVNPTLGQTP